MARNAKTNKELVEQPEAGIQPVQETATADNNTQATPGTSEGGEQELQVPSESGSSEETHDIQNPEMDSEDQTEATGETGGEADDQLNDQDDVYAEAKAVIKEMVKKELEESGVLPDEPKEKTENRLKIAKDVFLNNASKSVLYFTSDLIPFFEKSDAHRHAGTLSDDTVVTINKD